MGLLKTVRTINMVIAKHYASLRPSMQDMAEHDAGLRDAAYADIERLIEEGQAYIRERDKDAKDTYEIAADGTKKIIKARNPWGRFEKMAAIDSVGRLQQMLMDNRNWNASKHNPTLVLQQNNTLNVFDSTSHILKDPECEEGFQDIIDGLKEELDM